MSVHYLRMAAERGVSAFLVQLEDYNYPLSVDHFNVYYL